VAVIGYGNQGRAQSLNLRDNGVNVRVGLLDSSRSREIAEADDFSVFETGEAVRQVRVVMMCVPDMKMGEVFDASIRANLQPGSALLFSHGFAIRYGLIEPPQGIDVALVSPKGAGHGVRQRFLEGSGVPGLVAVHQDASGEAEWVALSYAWGIGCIPGLVFRTTFAEETETDLFGEQAVLCGGLPELIRAAFQTLVEAGYSSEVAYFECLHEVKIISDLLVSGGIAGMRSAISDTAQWGGLTAGPKVVGPEARRAMEELLAAIKSGEFAEEWKREAGSGKKSLAALMRAEATEPIENVGAEIRAKMPDSQ
jgi:ketol-acid reductoisomerase